MHIHAVRQNGKPYKQVSWSGKFGILVIAYLCSMFGIWAVTQIDLTTQVKGLLPVANAGTGAATFSAHYFFGNSTGSTAAPGPGLIGAADSTPPLYAVGGGSGTALTATPTPAVPSLVTGLEVHILSGFANSGTSPTFAVSGLTAKTITKCGTTALVANDINTSAWADLRYDGTEYQLLNPQVIPCGAILTGTFADDETPTGSLPGTALTLAHSPNPAASLMLFYNGQKIEPGGVDYTLSGTGITLAATAPAGTVFTASYRY